IGAMRAINNHTSAQYVFPDKKKKHKLIIPTEITDNKNIAIEEKGLLCWVMLVIFDVLIKIDYYCIIY
ncbi:MAG: hypothetical protein ACTSUV_06765, partial [Candidatus Ranarchaeia archaeon]